MNSPTILDVVAGTSSAIATLIAMLAVLLSRAQMREVHRFWQAERRSEVYRAVVREPVMRCRDAFLSEVRNMLHGCIEGIRDALSEGQESVAEDTIGQLLTAFNRAYHRYRDELAEFRNIHSLKLVEFTKDVVQCTSEFQDEFTRLVDVPVDGPWNPSLESKVAAALGRHSARVADLLARHDPCLRPTQDQPRKWLLRRSGRRSGEDPGPRSTVT